MALVKDITIHICSPAARIRILVVLSTRCTEHYIVFIEKTENISVTTI